MLCVVELLALSELFSKSNIKIVLTLKCISVQLKKKITRGLQQYVYNLPWQAA